MDWILFGAVIPLLGFGILTMNSFTGEGSFFEKQIIWAGISLGVFFLLSFVDFSFLRRTNIVMFAYIFVSVILIILFGMAHVIKGAQSWISFGLFSFQPSELAKLVLILVLAKYFSRRHVEIANIRHIFVSGFYAFFVFILVMLQPDFGSSIIIFLIWLGMVFVSGISKRHLLLVFLVGLVAFGGLWFFGFKDYQKARIKNFMNPLADIHKTGYNAYQSTIAVGSGQILGKGIGYGTQSKLKFLPEYQTDFIFAAFAEEWGLLGVITMFILFSIVIWRILINAYEGATNFEILFGLGLAVMFIAHFTINIGMNIGLLPVTGVTVPFLSYGGTHLLIEFTGLGILMGIRRHSRSIHKELIQKELVGV
ncbi:MAG: rod shape-determining protein RodA [bacterium]|nr:rod shape-determining protein RodA [bacterium]